MTKTLKPCPFCSGEAEIYADSIYFVECKNCKVGTRIKATEPEAIAAWNKRDSLSIDEIRAVVYQIFTEHGSYECNIRPKKNGNCNCGSKDCRKIIMQAFEKASKESNLIEFIEKEGGK